MAKRNSNSTEKREFRGAGDSLLLVFRGGSPVAVREPMSITDNHCLVGSPD
jgi:hypothetical protein